MPSIAQLDYYTVPPSSLASCWHEHLRSTTPPYTASYATDMGNRPNRKRTRHRPSRSRRQLDEIFPSIVLPITSFHRLPSCNNEWKSTSTASSSIVQPAWPYQSASHRPLTPPSRTSSRGSQVADRAHSTSKSTLSSQRPESQASRDRRIFGGDEDDDEVSAGQLRGPMLDVVLSLFNGVDFEDAC